VGGERWGTERLNQRQDLRQQTKPEEKSGSDRDEKEKLEETRSCTEEERNEEAAGSGEGAREEEQGQDHAVAQPLLLRQ